MVKGQYGEFTVLVDGETVVDGGALAALGVVPSARKVVDAVRASLQRRRSTHPGSHVDA
jgi:hypothetical protein